MCKPAEIGDMDFKTMADFINHYLGDDFNRLTMKQKILTAAQFNFHNSAKDTITSEDIESILKPLGEKTSNLSVPFQRMVKTDRFFTKEGNDFSLTHS